MEAIEVTAENLSDLEHYFLHNEDAWREVGKEHPEIINVEHPEQNIICGNEVRGNAADTTLDTQIDMRSDMRIDMRQLIGKKVLVRICW
jgi:hypothetical protein